MKNKPIIIIGNGGHARALIEILLMQSREIIGFTAPTQQVNPFGFTYLGKDESIEQYHQDEIILVLGLGTIQISSIRKEIFDRFKKLGYTFESTIHPKTIISPTVQFGEGVQIMAGAIVQTNTKIADNTIINTGTIIDHDCIIDAHTHLAPGVTVSGSVHIGESCHIGTAATIIQGITVGKKSLVGAGAVVVSNIANEKKVVGVPAKEV
ncbi:acetyltransferase [Psychrobacillus sp. FJAT-51614]|uniref:Acetyltransferase n=1 Tax=Psychrobacillus mangrovi TaxID=3117745 RepID=A0ABU8F3M5_9BACI